MPSTWLENSEVVFGLVIINKLSLTQVRPEIFHVPYNEGIKLLQASTPKEDVALKIGIDAYQTSIQAAECINGAAGLSWPSILEKSAVSYDAGIKLEKHGKKLQRGEEIDWSQLSYISQRAQSNTGAIFTPLGEIEVVETPFIETGWEVFDEHIGGLPSCGLVIVGGQPGVGKTTWMAKLASSFAHTHTDKNVVVFSIEMVLTEIGARFRQLGGLNKDVANRILLDDTPVTPEEAINKAASVDNLGIVLIDFADLMIRGETTESAMAHIYRTLMLGAKQLHCPIVLLSQLSRYSNGIPKPTNLRWTGLAEALAWMILMLYNPSTDWHSKSDNEEEQLPALEHTAYVICWKVRGGFRKHLEDSPGAIAIPFRGDKGWHSSKGKWFSMRK
jgi:hypothetical protein